MAIETNDQIKSFINLNKALVFGAAVIDVGFHLNENEMPDPDKSTQARDITVTPGGKGLAQAVALARLGFDVLFATVIGDRRFHSVEIENILADEKINKDLTSEIKDKFVRVERDKQTPITGVFVYKNGTGFAVGEKEELQITKEQVDAIFASEEFEKIKFILITFELPTKIVNYILEKLNDDKYKNITVIVTPAPPDLDNKSRKALKRIDYLVASVWEIQKLVRDENEVNVDSLMAALANYSIRNVCILTDEGVEFNLIDNRTFIKSLKEGNDHDIAAQRDAFCAALAYILSKTDYIDEEGKLFAIAAMACTTAQEQGVYSGMPDVEAIETRMKWMNK